MFSLNFSLAGKGPFMASKAKNISGGGGSGVRDKAPPSRGNLGAKFSETSFPHSKTYFTQIGRCYFSTTILKRSISIIFHCLQCSLSKMLGPEKEKLCIL